MVTSKSVITMLRMILCASSVELIQLLIDLTLKIAIRDRVRGKQAKNLSEKPL